MLTLSSSFAFAQQRHASIYCIRVMRLGICNDLANRILAASIHQMLVKIYATESERGSMRPLCRLIDSVRSSLIRHAVSRATGGTAKQILPHRLSCRHAMEGAQPSTLGSEPHNYGALSILHLHSLILPNRSI